MKFEFKLSCPVHGQNNKKEGKRMRMFKSGFEIAQSRFDQSAYTLQHVVYKKQHDGGNNFKK